MIVYEWIDKKGNPRRICIGSKKACGELKPLGTNSVNNHPNVILTIEGKKYSDEAFIKVDKNINYGLIYKTPTELAFKNSKEEGRLVKLDQVMLDFKDTGERLSITSLISIIENSEESQPSYNEDNKCFC